MTRNLSLSLPGVLAPLLLCAGSAQPSVAAACTPYRRKVCL